MMERERLYCSKCGEARGFEVYTCREGGKSVPRGDEPMSEGAPVDELGGYARRDKVVSRLCNFLLRFASRRYRTMIGGSIRYGLKAAARDALEDELPETRGRRIIGFGAETRTEGE